MADYAIANPHLGVTDYRIPKTETALQAAPFWCTKRVVSAHFDWHWRERPALALLAWEPYRDPPSRLRSIAMESTRFSLEEVGRVGARRNPPLGCGNGGLRYR
jgi:hypothetical protein